MVPGTEACAVVMSLIFIAHFQPGFVFGVTESEPASVLFPPLRAESSICNEHRTVHSLTMIVRSSEPTA
uniref:Putative secreted protein n=1 Tax=Anopheles darlingi TaxID=43151 RepID=A0A2M4DD63_ANODA